MFYFLRTLIVLAFLYPSLSSFASEQNFYENDSAEETDTEQNKVSDDIVNSCAPQCKELKVGECRKPVSCSRLESPAKKSSAFKVCKTGKNKLTAHLNITFYKDSGKGANSIRNAARRFPSKANDTDRKWRKKTQACINRFRNRLNDGKKSLDIKLHSISSKKGSSNILIEVESDRQRSLDVSWRKDIDCETILHEVGHHLGLCDEYKVHKNDRLLVGAPGETIIKKNVFSSSHSNKNYQPRRSCRALGHKNSLMRNPTRALHGPKNIRYIMCKCNGARKDDLSRCRYNHPSIEQIYLSNDPDDLKKAVQAQAIRKKNRGCPRGFSPTTRSPKVFGKNKEQKTVYNFRKWIWDLQLNANRHLKDKEEKQGFPFVPVIVGVKNIPGSQPSAFQKKHIDSIEYPNCGKKNKKYYKCASLAYKRSTNCPKSCTDEEWTKE